jgi:hypothetical protein
MSSPAARARVLIPVTYGFSVRYLVPTGLLDRLAEVVDPVVALGWEDTELESELRSHGCSVVRLPPAELDHDYRMFRRRLAAVHDRRLRTPTEAIRRRRQLAMIPSLRARWINRARHGRDRLAAAVPGTGARLEGREAAEVQRGTNVAAFVDLLRSDPVDLVLSLTPYHDQDGLLLWAARSAGVQSVTSVISFDNPTTRERMLVRSDRIAVWNRFNAAELLRSYPDLSPDRLRITGAPQFDLHVRPDLVMPREDWSRRLGLPPDRPIVLHGAGPEHLVPGEPKLVRLLDDAIDTGSLPGNPFLLVRLHPSDDGARWGELRRTLRHGVIVDPWTPASSAMRSWPTRDDIAVQMSSLAHSEVHVNVCSSMTLDGAMFDRPQVGPSFAPGEGPQENRRIAEMYRQEHWAPIAASGGLAMAHDANQLVDAVAASLADPARDAPGRRRMLDAVLTHTDGSASRRLVDLVAQVAST